jgi:copper chaperone CopZ
MISTLTLKAVTCPMCANSVSNALHSVQGVQNLDVDFFDQITTITFDDDTTNDAFIRTVVEGANCSAH